MQIDHYTCEQVVRLLDDFIDRELSSREMQQVQEHLDLCAICAAEFRFEAQTIRAIRERVQHIAVPSGLRERIAATLKAAREEHDAPQPDQSADTAG
jgi:anti-sigma factor (TIGR02949 family)